MNRKDKADYDRLYNQIEAIKNNKDVKVIPLKDADTTVNFYYIIYGKEKKLEDEFNVYGDPYGINKDKKTLAISICVWIILVANSTRVLLLHLDDITNLLVYILGIGICGSIMITIMDIRHFLIVRYAYNKFFVNRNSKLK